MKAFRTFAATCAVSALLINSVLAQTAVVPPPTAPGTFVPSSGQAGKDVVWVPTPQNLVDRMLEMGKVTKDDYVIDLGSGDGRTVITAAKLGAKAHGIEYNPDMVELSKKNAAAAGVSDRASFEKADIFESDYSKATVITLFLLTQLNAKLRPTLLDMKPGTRVLSNTFDMGDWISDNKISAGGDCTSWCTAYLWIIPAKVGGTWKVGDSALKLEQKYQMLSGDMTMGGKATPISDAKMDGTKITFKAGAETYTGEVAGNKMSGKTASGKDWTATKG